MKKKEKYEFLKHGMAEVISFVLENSFFCVLTSLFLLNMPRSTVTDSIYGRKRSYMVSYTTVYMSYTLRIRPYFAGIHVIVLRSYITVTVYRDIRRKTEIVYEALRS
jgi:hypothetical protein